MPPRYIAVPFTGPGPVLPIPTPTLNATVVSGTQINLSVSYSGPPGAVSYSFEQASSGSGPFVPLASGTSPTFNDTGLTPSTFYFFRCRVQVADGRFSDYSLVKSASTLASTPVAPTGVSAVDIDSTSIRVTWNLVAGATSYNVYQGGVLDTAGATSPFIDSGLLPNTPYTYNVSALNISGEGPLSSPSSATTVPASLGGKFKFNPSIYYIFIDQNQSRASQLARMQALKAANPRIRGFQVFWVWADLENPALVGGNAQYDGSWASQTDVNQMKGFKLMDTFVTACANMGCQFALHIYSYGGASAPGAQSANYPSSFAPAYGAGSASSPYGPNTATSNGVNGMVWQNSYTVNQVGVAKYYRYWVPAVMGRIIALGQAYGARYDSNPNVEMFDLLDESAMSTQTGYSDAGAASTMIGPGNYFQALRAAWPHTMLRWWGNYVGSSVPRMDDMLAAAYASDWSVGGPDTTNESGPSFRAITADWRWRQLTAALGNGGVVDPSVPDYRAIGGHNVREVEPEDLNNPPSAAAGNRHLGDGDPVSIVTQANLMQATHMFWYDNGFAGPDSNQTDTAHPNLLDFLSSAAQGGNVSVNGRVAGIALTNHNYPSSFPQ